MCTCYIYTCMLHNNIEQIIYVYSVYILYIIYTYTYIYHIYIYIHILYIHIVQSVQVQPNQHREIFMCYKMTETTKPNSSPR